MDQSNNNLSTSAAKGPERSGPLDPYRDWLNIRSLERPPSPYQLLGLAELETDPKAIAEAARQAKKTVRAYQIGQYRTEALALMTEIGQAADLLTNSEKKAALDADRHRHLLAMAEANFPQAQLDQPLDDLFAQWLQRCDNAGLPVAQLLPDLMLWCLKRPFAWPPRGPLNVALPLGLWIYFEATVVGQCVGRSPLEKRVQAVKQAQHLFGVSVPLSRIINLDIARRPDSFADSALVRQAAEEPRQLMQEWVNRLAGGGGGQRKGTVLDVDSPAYRALAFLLGLVDETGRTISEPVHPEVIPAASGPSRLAAVAAEGSDFFARTMLWLRDRSAGHPQLMAALKIALLISGGVVLLLLILLLLWPGS